VENSFTDQRFKSAGKKLPGPIVRTSLGFLRGIFDHDRLAFYGVPYAEPPTGPQRRFRPPQKKMPWQGILEANRYGPAACQPGVLDFNPRQSEDCLTLNIWTKATKGPLRPVLLFIHGGGFTGGSGADPAFHGGTFADQGLVVITVNYRLGVFGFLDLSDCLGEDYRSSGNCGILDLIEALQWTKANITAFGGDPNRITIMGQSAGAKCVGGLLSSSLADGLFCGAIAQSGAVQAIREQSTATAIADRYLQLLELQRDDARKLLELPAEALMDAQSALCRDFSGVHFFGPVVDNVVIESPPMKSVQRKRHSMPALLIGTNRHEAANLEIGTPGEGAGPDGFLSRMFGDRAPLVKAAYLRRSGRALLQEPSDLPAWRAVITDYMYRISAARTAAAYNRAGADVWMYSFERNGELNSAHGDEMPFVFGRATGENEQKLATVMHDAWAAFIHTGNPETVDTGKWPRHHVQQSAVMRFTDSGSVLGQLDIEDDPNFPDQVYCIDGAF